MHFQIVNPFELYVAKVAHERRFYRVCAHVFLQTPFPRELPLADVTIKCLFTCVNLQMMLQVVRTHKALAAYVAGVRFLAVVSAHVLLHVGRVQMFVANCAFRPVFLGAADWYVVTAS